MTAGNKWSRKLVADVWTFRARSTKSAEAFEAELRAGFKKAGERLPWDNTRVPGRGRRLGRSGQGIPMPKEQTETEFIDEVEQLRVRHAPPNIPPRRGESSTQKAKLKKAAAEKAEATEVEQTAEKAAPATAKVEQAAADTATRRPPMPQRRRPPRRRARRRSRAPSRPPPRRPPRRSRPRRKPAAQATSKLEQTTADTVTKAAPEVEAAEGGTQATRSEQAAEKVGGQATSKLEQAATETVVKAGAEGALTRGLGATALEVVFNPALMFGWEVLKGISSDYQQGWDDIRRPARHIGFAQGWAARLAGLDITWIKWNLAPQFVDRSDVATEALGATGMAEHAYIVGLGEGFRYGAGYSDALKAKKLGQAFEKIKARHEEVYFDTDKALTRNSLILVAAMLQQEADRAISRWDDLREQRKKAAEREAESKRRSENWTGHMQ